MSLRAMLSGKFVFSLSFLASFAVDSDRDTAGLSSHFLAELNFEPWASPWFTHTDGLDRGRRKKKVKESLEWVGLSCRVVECHTHTQ